MPEVLVLFVVRGGRVVVFRGLVCFGLVGRGLLRLCMGLLFLGSFCSASGRIVSQYIIIAAP